MKIRLEFSTDNASFGGRNSPEYCAEVCFIMSKVTSKITNGEPWGFARLLMVGDNLMSSLIRFLRAPTWERRR